VGARGGGGGRSAGGGGGAAGGARAGAGRAGRRGRGPAEERSARSAGARGGASEGARARLSRAGRRGLGPSEERSARSARARGGASEGARARLSRAGRRGLGPSEERSARSARAPDGAPEVIDRYTRPEMGRLWSEEARLARWLEVELALVEALAERGEVPVEAARTLRARARVDAARIRAIEAEVKHDVIAFVSSVAETVGDEGRFLHLGLTSSDVVDTAFALQLRDAADLLLAGIDRLRAAVRAQALRHRRTPMIGRTLGILAGTCERIAVEIRHLQRTEVGEVLEPFAPGQKGSSAMPHKRNPILAENVTGLARLVRAYAAAALENMALWHERDLSHSSVERVIGPDATIVMDFMLARLADVIEGLEVRPEVMRANLERLGGAIFSEQVLLALVRRGVKRDEAYRW